MMEIHRFCLIWPDLKPDAPRALTDDIEKHGQLEDIWTFQDSVLEGRHRWLACKDLGIEPRFKAFEGTEEQALAFCVSKNGARRHLSTSQRSMVAARIANCTYGGKRAAGRITSAAAARMLNVSLGSVRRAEAVISHGVPELQDAVTQGKVPVRPADRLSRKPVKAQQKLLAKGTAAIKSAANPTSKPKPDPLDHIHRFVDEMCLLDADRANRLATKAHALINDGLRWVMDHQASPDTSIVRLAPSSDRSPKPTLPRLGFLERPDLSQEAAEG
jgi:ParB-like chromosome segregation protein Spo0J